MFTLPVKSLSSHCHCPLEQLEMVEVDVVYLWLLTTWLQPHCAGMLCCSANAKSGFPKPLK